MAATDLEFAHMLRQIAADAAATAAEVTAFATAILNRDTA